MYLIIGKVNGHMGENYGNKYLLILQMKTKNEKSTDNIVMELKMKLKQ